MIDKSRLLSGLFFWAGLLLLIIYAYSPSLFDGYVTFSNPYFLLTIIAWCINVIYYIVESQ